MSDRETLREAVRVKASLLAEGLVPTERALAAFGRPFLSKRRAYGNPDDHEFLGQEVPQELYLLPSGLICAVNIRGSSSWSLDEDTQGFFLQRADTPRIAVTFPAHPAFYDWKLKSGAPVNSMITLYGGASLGVFIYGSCALVDMEKACHYCSIQPNRSMQDEFASVVRKRALQESLSIALQDRACPIRQVMLNGGNFPDPDRSFRFYAEMARIAREAIDGSGRDVELHLIVYPPLDTALFELLAGLDVRIAMNCEVWAPELFERFCPGKAAVSGQARIVRALQDAAKTLAAGSVYSIFVGGLEPIESLDAGLRHMVAAGVTPVINVFHSDPGTPLRSLASPTQSRILEMGRALQEAYACVDFVHPFYLGCGRNAIDTEAHWRLFS